MVKIQQRKAFSHGLRAERLCKIFLRLKGYTILEHRFRTPVGEIDIVALKGKMVIAVEVKSRATLQKAIESLSSYQCQRIERALQWFLTKNLNLAAYEVRFDVVLVSSWRIHHLKNAWWSNN